MPYKPYVPCRHPGCSALVPPGQKYCEAHKPLHPEEARAASKRGYNARWEKESKRFLVEHPLCIRCMLHSAHQINLKQLRQSIRKKENKMRLPSEAQIESLRKQYPAGSRVKLVAMDDPQAPAVGTEGTVIGVDDVGSIMVAWDTGSTLSVALGVDICARV